MRQTGLARSQTAREGACAYCGVRRGVNQDHVVPASVAKKFRHAPGACPCALHERKIPEEWLVTVDACFECNNRKGARRLVPPSWGDKVDALNEFFGGTPWRVWDGDPKSEAFRSVHR